METQELKKLRSTEMFVVEKREDPLGQEVRAGYCGDSHLIVRPLRRGDEVSRFALALDDYGFSS